MIKRWKPEPIARLTLRNGKKVEIERNIIMGTCSFGFESSNISIAIDNRLNEFDTLDTLIHEFLHAECPNEKEANIDSLSTSVAKMLWKIGYRRKQIKKNRPR